MPAVILISICIALFLLLKILWFIAPESLPQIVDLLGLPAGGQLNWVHILAPVSYMFTHIDFWHLLINCLWLAWFGGMLGEVAGRSKVIPVFLSGGLLGALMYLSCSTLFAIGDLPPGTMLIGASASTLAVITATLVVTPGRRVTLALIGTFPLKWIAAAGLAIFILASLEMAPAQIAAHCGGIAAGLIWATVLLASTRRNARRMKLNTRRSLAHAALIRKVRDLGYNSLSREEKLTLFNISRHQPEATTADKN